MAKKITPAQVLDVEFYSNDLDETLTVRDYCKTLLTTLFDEGESFSGKRPLGNSGWEYDIATPLIACGFLKGTLDDDGRAEDFDFSDFAVATAQVVGAL